MSFWSWLAGLFTREAPSSADHETAGPPDDEHPLVPARQVLDVSIANMRAAPNFAPDPAWKFGLWQRAEYRPAHPGRVGPQIVPRAVVVHTTDMHPDDFGGLIKSWQAQPGAGNCAHFLIGRTAEQGVIQFAPVTRNANHAGGRSHGWWKTAAGALVHPNTISVGIEIHCAGRLKKDPGGRWRTDDGKLVNQDEVFTDANGHGWHTITGYQTGVLKQLLRELESCLAPWDNMTVVPNGGYIANGVPWAEMRHAESCRVVGHVTLDPNNKTDPGPLGMALVKNS